MADRRKQTRRAVALSDPEDPEEEGYPVKRRTLHRVLAVAVAIAAISPLFAVDPNGCARSSTRNRATHQIRPSQTLEHPHR